jgi:hypothetical protein
MSSGSATGLPRASALLPLLHLALIAWPLGSLALPIGTRGLGPVSPTVELPELL